MMKLTALKIDPEFQGKIPPLTFEELEQLEKTLSAMVKLSTPSSSGKGWLLTVITAIQFFRSTRTFPTLSMRKNLQIGLKRLSGFVRISWGGEISRQNRKSTLLENSMMLKKHPMELQMDFEEINTLIW